MQQADRRAAGEAPSSGSPAERCLAALLSLAALAALMSLLAASLLLQLGPPRPGTESQSQSPVPGPLARRLLRCVSRALASLSLSLHLCCLLLALMHGYLAAEIRGGDTQPDRAGWFLLNSRCSRRLALSAFCLGVIVYLAALSIYLLLEFEKESAIASASVLGTGALALSIIVVHALAKSWRMGRTALPERGATLFENNRVPRGGWPDTEHVVRGEVEEEPSSRLPAFRRETAYERYREQKAFYVATSASRAGPAVTARDRYERPRALSAAGRGVPCAAPWEGVTHEMRRVQARKGTVCRKDSTLV
uniref:transmembrane protein 221 n=1 Tax=Pristiophorus japonicus TaxID=55135 RepID=UPI00398EDD28